MPKLAASRASVRTLCRRCRRPRIFPWPSRTMSSAKRAASVRSCMIATTVRAGPGPGLQERRARRADGADRGPRRARRRAAPAPASRGRGPAAPGRARRRKAPWPAAPRNPAARPPQWRPRRPPGRSAGSASGLSPCGRRPRATTLSTGSGQAMRAALGQIGDGPRPLGGPHPRDGTCRSGSPLPAAGTISPASARSRVVLPAPLGPSTTVKRPGSRARSRPARRAAVPEIDRQGAGFAGDRPHHAGVSASSALRRAITQRKNGTPSRAVSTPILTSALRRNEPHGAIGREQQCRPGETCRHEGPGRIVADEGAHEMGRHEADEADGAGHRHRGAGADGGAGDDERAAAAARATPRLRAVSSPSARARRPGAAERISARGQEDEGRAPAAHGSWSGPRRSRGARTRSRSRRRDWARG